MLRSLGSYELVSDVRGWTVRAGVRVPPGVRAERGAMLGRALATGRKPACAAVVWRSRVAVAVEGVGRDWSGCMLALGVAEVDAREVVRAGVVDERGLLAAAEAVEEAAEDRPDSGVAAAAARPGGASCLAGDARVALTGDAARDCLPLVAAEEEVAETDEREASEGRVVDIGRATGGLAAATFGFSGLLLRALMETRDVVAGGFLAVALVLVSVLLIAGVRGGCWAAEDGRRGTGTGTSSSSSWPSSYWPT